MKRAKQTAADFNDPNIKSAEFVNAASLSLPMLTGPNDTIRVMARFQGTGATVEIKAGTVTLVTYTSTSIDYAYESILIVAAANDAYYFGGTSSGASAIVEDTTNDYTTTAVTITVTGAQAGTVYMAYGV